MIYCLRYIPPQLYPTKVPRQKGGYKRGMTVVLNNVKDYWTISELVVMVRTHTNNIYLIF